MTLFTEYQLGGLTLKNRMVLSPMTRSRALDRNVPNPLAIAYYVQRASAGLIVTEATQVSPRGVGYVRTPGIHSAEQVAGWRPITDAVHAEGGRIFLQLWHVGRVSHPDFHGGELPVAPSAIAASGQVYTPTGPKPTVAPRAPALSEISGVVEEFRRGAEQAKAAGFDGVELHGANGYLLDQFLRDGSNQRTDTYGGSLRNRARFPIEVAEAVAAVWGPERVGYKVSPDDLPSMSMVDSDPAATFAYLARELSALGLCYLHVTEPMTGRAPDARLTPGLRSAFRGALIANGGYDGATGDAAIASGRADLVSYGAVFLANPDLPRRFHEDAPLNAPDPRTFYSGEAVGYVDYPSLADFETSPLGRP